jgi:mono/diheme cytochrome c family protein
VVGVVEKDDIDGTLDYNARTRLNPLFEMPPAMRFLGLCCFAIASLPGLTVAWAQDDDEEPEYRSGLVARYTDVTGKDAVRRDADVAFVWRDSAPDPRLSPGKFTAVWQGRLFTIAQGAYTLHVHAAGKVRLTLNDNVLLDVDSPSPTWTQAKPAELSYGYHPLKLEYTAAADAQIGLYWSGPQFQLEPIPSRHLFHLPAEAPSERFEQGQVLARALRCGACHQVPGETAALTAPALDRVRGNLEPSWVVDWLSSKEPTRETASEVVTEVPRRMPHFALEESDARAIAAYLFDASHDAPEPLKFEASMVATPPAPAKGKKPKKPRTKPSATEGERLVDTLGCLACHRVNDLGQLALFGGGDLTRVADKRPEDFFGRWLTKPEEVNRAHRMPTFKLDAIEWADLAEYLSNLKGTGAEKKKPAKLDTDKKSIARGRELVQTHRCGSCHQLGEKLESPAVARLRLNADAKWDTACLAAPEATTHRPGYNLTAAQREAVREYIVNAVPSKGAYVEGEFVLKERNCLGCHSRDEKLGIAPHLDAVAKHDPELATLLPALAPPSLSGVGDKLNGDALEAAILLKRPPLRPWLSIRMPRFDLSSDEMKALTGHFVDHDRIPDLPATEVAQADDAAQLLAARRLVTADGFGCTSCHKIGNSEPLNVALNAHGTDLTMLGERIRKPWYDRWVRNPARIVPRMEMPAIQMPVRGVLHDNVNEQLAAVWNTINTPGFNPPPPGPVRVVRSKNVPEAKEQASVVTDVFEIDEQVFIRPIVIGLPNRHNVMFDLVTGRLAQWWIGDTAMERTRGKAWYWTIGGEPILPDQDENDQFSDVWLQRDRTDMRSVRTGQCKTILDQIEHTSDGVRIKYRATFASENGDDRKTLSISQTFSPAGDRDGFLGFRRTIEVIGLTDRENLLIDPMPDIPLGYKENTLTPSRKLDIANEVEAAPDLLLRIKVLAGGVESSFGCGPLGSVETSVVYVSNGASAELEYQLKLPVDQFLVDAPALPNMPKRTLKVVPGWEATQLSLPTAEMPTGFDWRKDGTLVLSSLKGRVCLARDTDGDGLEDAYTTVSDDLPAPYGVAAVDDRSTDVICKYGLVRLHDDDGDGRAERSEVVADGWGMTEDYHDWAVGLPRDPDGNYIIALPCQQDDRDEAAAAYRGQALRLLPRDPTPDNPRLFRIEPISAGLRFPMGIALNRKGAIFASDNQGNYNPYNEINHLLPGRRYGFINKREVAPGFNPPFDSPAIELPHPWTRSVNGLCFLDTPDAVRKELGRDLFGPFEGHLVGCEYTTLRLIRMTLERIGDTYQGAAYPMSVEPAAGEPTFEGPVVPSVAPDGDLYIGNMRDSGWGGGQNSGSIVRLRPAGDVPLGIREVRATHDGFSIEFTGPIDAKLAANPKHYSILSYRRISTPAYGGENVDEKAGHVKNVKVSDDARQVTLKLDAMRAGHVYELRIEGIAPEGRTLFPAEAYYTLRQVP